MELLTSQRCFNGEQRRYQHHSVMLNCMMTVSVFLPEKASDEQRVPVVYWLSGLTCTDENFSQKAGAQRIANELGIALAIPDTSPRGDGIDDVNDYDLGQGASFYVNATHPPWDKHYQMYDYIVEELPMLIEQFLPVNQRRSICGHSMGGHGALTIGLRNPHRYQSVSAFSPICNPSSSPWGKKAFTHYLGNDEKQWHQYDASLLIDSQQALLPILIDQGDQDEYLTTQLLPNKLLIQAKQRSALTFRMQHGYDHSYFFIATFIEEHLRYHARFLNT